MIRLGFNVKPLILGHKVRGIGSYTFNLLNELKKLPELDVLEFKDIKELSEVDLIHYPYFDLFFPTLPFSKKFPVIVTIHDVIPLMFPEQFPPGIKGWVSLQHQKTSLKNVSAIITNSETSKRNIIKYLAVAADKIFVTPLAPATVFRKVTNKKLLSQVSSKYQLPEKFAIYIGSVNWNKNIVTMSQACVDAGINLYLIGKDFSNQDNLDHPERRSYKEFLEKYANSPLIHRLGYLEIEDLVNVLNLATMCLLPSFYEGFGIPIIEAQACGIPVLTSDIPVIEEVAGDSVLKVNPSNPEDMARAISHLASDQSLQRKLAEKGLKNSEQFTWSKTAIATLAVYNQVLKR